MNVPSGHIHVPCTHIDHETRRPAPPPAPCRASAGHRALGCGRNRDRQAVGYRAARDGSATRHRPPPVTDEENGAARQPPTTGTPDKQDQLTLSGIAL